MGEEFYGVIKLITGEEIFAMISVDENDGDPIVMLQRPVTMKMLNSPTGQYVKIKPWLELPNEDMFLIRYDRIVTMSEVSDKQIIHFYERYINDDDVDIEIDGKVKINEKMGFITTVEEARKRLEEIYKINIES
tara:strand:- start:164 stop:565 length:402 start_codon:yes stop_codon:yes gene_type:complete